MKKTGNNPYENLFNEEEVSQCHACGGSLKKDKVNLEEFEGGKLYVIEQVPAYVCQSCGEIWVPAPVIKDFEKMLETSKRHALTKELIKAAQKKPANKKRKKKSSKPQKTA